MHPHHMIHDTKCHIPLNARTNSIMCKVSLTQLAGTIHNICKVRGSNSDQHKKKHQRLCSCELLSVGGDNA